MKISATERLKVSMEVASCEDPMEKPNSPVMSMRCCARGIGPHLWDTMTARVRETSVRAGADSGIKSRSLRRSTSRSQLSREVSRKRRAAASDG